MRYLLAGVLLAVVVGEGRLNAGVIRPGMNQDEVNQAIGVPARSVAVGAPDGSFVKLYILNDCVGGRTHLFVDLARNGLATGCDAYYELFVAQPPWLDKLIGPLSPPRKAHAVVRGGW